MTDIWASGAIYMVSHNNHYARKQLFRSSPGNLTFSDSVIIYCISDLPFSGVQGSQFGHSYFVGYDDVSWSVANAFCLSQGGGLVTIETIDEATWLTDLVDTSSNI